VNTEMVNNKHIHLLVKNQVVSNTQLLKG